MTDPSFYQRRHAIFPSRRRWTFLLRVSAVTTVPFVRLMWCLLGASAGMGIALSVAGPREAPFLLASLGGSTVFLFGLTKAPAAQPRALFGGHLGGALIGVVCYQTLGDSLPVYALAISVTLGLMLLTRTLHPPAGANPILMIHVHASWGVLFQPVLLGVFSLAVIAYFWSRAYPGLAHYPVSLMEPFPSKMDWGGWE